MLNKLTLEFFKHELAKNLDMQKIYLTQTEVGDIICTDVYCNSEPTPIQIVSSWSIIGYTDEQKEPELALSVAMADDEQMKEKFLSLPGISICRDDISTEDVEINEGLFYEDPGCEGCFFCLSSDIDELAKVFETICCQLLGYDIRSRLGFHTWYDRM